MQTATADIGRSVPCDSAQTRSQGYQGALNGDLDGKLYCVVYGDGSAAFGQLGQADGKPCPTGSWLASGWYAEGFFRKGAGDSGKITLRVAGNKPDVTNIQPVRWFMPATDQCDIDAVWADFLTNIRDPAINHRLRDVTRGEPFGGLKGHVVVIHHGLRTLLPVVGLVMDGKKIGYQIDLSFVIPGQSTAPVAVVRGWGEVDNTNNCRVVYRDARHSLDAKFELAVPRL